MTHKLRHEIEEFIGDLNANGSNLNTGEVIGIWEICERMYRAGYKNGVKLPTVYKKKRKQKN